MHDTYFDDAHVSAFARVPLFKRHRDAIGLISLAKRRGAET